MGGIIMKDINEEKRFELYKKIIEIERKEHEFSELKRKYERTLEEFWEEFKNISRQTEQHLKRAKENEQFIYENREFERLARKYVDNQKESLNNESKKIGKNIKEKREVLVKERNNLPWE